jgi:hypothetical protein
MFKNLVLNILSIDLEFSTQTSWKPG